MFNFPAVNFHEIKKEVRNTIEKRCEKAVNITNKKDISVYWVNLNDEASLLKQYDKTAIEIKGQMSIDQKEDILTSFSKGDIKKLITKPTITSFGLNWQHCNHSVYFPTFSYEQYYQAIRRFWRFGQKKEVFIDLIISDGQQRILESLLAKKQKAIEMFQNLTDHANSIYKIQKKEFNQPILKPKFI
jgi:SNF2 family DNA or RNA helicase